MIETDPRYWDCDCAERYIQNKVHVPLCSSCLATHIDRPDSRVDEIANRELHARPDLIQPSNSKMNVRHAHEYWLRLQANAALDEARTLNEVSDHWVCGNPVENALDNDEPGMTDLMKLQMAHAAASLEAGRVLYHMELLHREIVRRGGRP